MRWVVLTILLCVGHAWAHPFVPPRPMPNAIAGPTDASVVSAFYNPAGLGYLRGFHFYAEGGPRIKVGSIERSSSEGPGGSTSIGGSDFDGFVGLAWDLRTDRFTFAVATFAPVVDLSDFGSSPVAYHNIDQRWVVWEQTLAASYKVASSFSFGVAANFAEIWLHDRFLRDAALAGGTPGVYQAGGLCGAAACGLENPAAAEEIRLRAFDFGVGFSLGVLYRPVDRLWLGLSYVSHIFNTDATDESGARVRPAAGGTYRGSNTIGYTIPDIIMLAARVVVNPRTEVEVMGRWVHYGLTSQLDVTAQGGTLGQLDPRLALPTDFLLDRGLQDAYAFMVAPRFRVGDKLRLSPSLMFETSAVEPSAVSAAAIDAPKLDLALTAEWKPVKHLHLGGHVGVTGYILGTVDSRFHPADQIACVDAHYSLDKCGAVETGAGLPSSSGKYTLFVVHLGLAIGVDY